MTGVGSYNLRHVQGRLGNAFHMCGRRTWFLSLLGHVAPPGGPRTLTTMGVDSTNNRAKV